ncbi:cob(I)yrinic acid a,c-diamide adenosyltransferase [Ruania suaedae]|uniref:cob(I)yrinic acid a,c-diamide adenosyltransferase n=1 Tax=Ruania suaedae TaxID=2897774 RepID=UPI001E507EE2|nr:cob(I)yrinic acid a,c-diamide adenosyltransferase [Ruania suaedae]UFU03856.1 cob(I)yrinic acid a,c-diamide adenosyltransferase [Ruania suaedae]
MSGPHVTSRPTSGIVMLFVGEGWGKSAAAYGYASRSIGRGWRTLVVQFLKGASWNAAERASGRRLGIEWPVFTRGATWAQDRPEHLGEEAWAVGREAILGGDHGLVVLDEITHAIAAGWVNEREVVETIAARPATTSVIMTGRTASRRVRGVADTVTRFERAKHQEKRGILD